MTFSDHHFFRRFSPALRTALQEVGQTKVFSSGASVFSVGDEHSDFYLLLSGRLQIYKLTRGGQKRILRTVQPGDTFGLVSLFDEQPMLISAVAKGEVQVFVVPRDQFMALLEQYSELSLFVINGLVKRIRNYGDAIASMSVYSTEQRLISYLLDLQEKQGSEKTGIVILPDTITTLAEQLGTVREVLSRTFSRLIKKGWLSKKSVQVKILNKRAMIDCLGER